MTAYIVFIRNHLNDPVEFAKYKEKGRAAKGDHKYALLANYGAHEVLEGEDSDGVVILSFPTMEEARAWYHSPAYQEAKRHRDKAATSRVVLVQGVD